MADDKKWEIQQYEDAIKYLQSQKNPENTKEIDDRIQELTAKMSMIQNEISNKDGAPDKKASDDGSDKKQEDEPKTEDPLDKREKELRIRALEEEEEERKKKREKEEEEERKAKRWGKTKKVASAANAVVTLGSGWMGFFIFSAVGIWGLDSISKYIGPTEVSFSLKDIWNITAWGVFLILMLAHIFKNRDSVGDWKEWVTYGIAMLTIIFVMFTGTLNWLGLIHFIFIVMIWMVIIKRNEENKSTSNLLLVFIIIVDFYRYAILIQFLPMIWVVGIMKFPFLLMGTIVYLGGKFPDKGLPQFAFWALIIILVLLNAQSIVLASKAVVGTEEGIAVTGVRDVIKGTWGGFKTLLSDIKKSTNQQLEYATGGYYTGKVEKNENEELGVYLENLQAADKGFYENEEVVVWGDLKARTLDQPIYVYMSCKANGANGKIVPETLASPEYLNKPEGGYKIEKLEQIGFECRFEPGQLKTGANEIKISAEFNFETLAFLKTYFMDVERIRALRKENIEPLKQYGIKDATPNAIFTNGPIKLGMGTIDPPLGVSAEEEAYSYIGVTVEKQWEGRIKNITEVTIQVPSVFELEPFGEELFCRGWFNEEGESEDGYTIYTMTEDAIRNIKTPINDFRSWRCSLTIPKASDALGNTPVTTYYYRANVKYVYEVEKPISVFVKGIPNEKTKLTLCEVNCTDSDGCICNADGCNTEKGSDVGKGFSCNNYNLGSSYSERTIEEDFSYIDSLAWYTSSMMALNNKCLSGDAAAINEAIDSDKNMDETEKKELKDAVMPGCESRSYVFFEITESLIVDKVDKGVDAFEVLGTKSINGQLSENQKETARAKKESFNTLLENVIAHLRNNNNNIPSEKGESNIIYVGTKRDELGGVSI